MVTVLATVAAVEIVGTVICGATVTCGVVTIGTTTVFVSSFSSVVVGFEMNDVSRDRI